MNQFLLYAILGLLAVLLDTPWLYVSAERWKGTVKKIQGGIPARFDWRWGVPTYFALGYLASMSTVTNQAFWHGLATYAVFDGTNLALFKDYPIDLAVADTIWGGILFSLIAIARKWLKI
jgi:uncharacterized membrane protein